LNPALLRAGGGRSSWKIPGGNKGPNLLIPHDYQGLRTLSDNPH